MNIKYDDRVAYLIWDEGIPIKITNKGTDFVMSDKWRASCWCTIEGAERALKKLKEHRPDWTKKLYIGDR